MSWPSLAIFGLLNQLFIEPRKWAVNFSTQTHHQMCCCLLGRVSTCR
jgi:hypothetical protein